jgi:hypothetical protein
MLRNKRIFGRSIRFSLRLDEDCLSLDGAKGD